jgi:hypothetical protein
MKTVHLTTDPQEAEFVRMVLREQEIESVLQNEGGAMSIFGMPTPAVPLVVAVADEDEAQARLLIDLALGEKQSDPEPDPSPEEDKAFEERVARSREEARSKWTLALCILCPCMIPFVAFSKRPPQSP